MKLYRLRYSAILVLLLVTTSLGIETSNSECDSRSRELLPICDTVFIRSEFQVTRPLIPAISAQSMSSVAPQTMMNKMLMVEEARVESEGDNPTYWRILAPVLITVAVGTSTWLLFTIRSG